MRQSYLCNGKQQVNRKKLKKDRKYHIPHMPPKQIKEPCDEINVQPREETIVDEPCDEINVHASNESLVKNIEGTPIKNIEDSLFRLEEHSKKSNERSNEIFMEAIHRAGLESLAASNAFDTSLYDVFPDIESCVIEDCEIFNPAFVIEMRDGKGHSIIENWDKTKGLLPGRKVIGFYHISLNHKCCKHTGKDCSRCTDKRHYSYNYGSSRTSFSNFINQKNWWSNGIGCIHGNNTYCHNLPSCTTPADYCHPICLEIDNYMNIYHSPTEFYIMINKTSFPLYAFYILKQNVNIVQNKYDELFAEGHTAQMLYNIFDSTNYTKKDNNQYYIDNIQKIVHNSYTQLFKFVNKFRNFNEYAITTPSEVDAKSSDKREEYTAQCTAQSRIIKNLEIKLTETLRNYKNASHFIDELTGKFNSTLCDTMHKSREIDQLKLDIAKAEQKLKETKQLHELEILKIEQKLKETLKMQELEYEKKEINLRRELVDANCFKTHCEAMELTAENIKKELTETKLELQRQKDMNKGLSDMVLSGKEEMTRLKNDNYNTILTVREYANVNESLLKSNDEYKKTIETLRKENKFLSTQITNKYDEQNDTLSMALNDRIKELEKEIHGCKEEYNKCYSEKMNLKSELAKIKKVLGEIK